MEFDIIEGLKLEEIKNLYNNYVLYKDIEIGACVCGNCSSRSESGTDYCAPYPVIHYYNECNNKCLEFDCNYYKFNSYCETGYSDTVCSYTYSTWSKCK